MSEINNSESLFIKIDPDELVRQVKLEECVEKTNPKPPENKAKVINFNQIKENKQK